MVASDQLSCLFCQITGDDQKKFYKTIFFTGSSILKSSDNGEKEDSSKLGASDYIAIGNAQLYIDSIEICGLVN